jgi:hypothetical protein
MNFFDHKDLENHLLQLCPKVVKHPVYIYKWDMAVRKNESEVDAYLDFGDSSVSTATGCRGGIRISAGARIFL